MDIPTFSIGFHSRGSVYCITKQTVTRHSVTDYTRNNRSWSEKLIVQTYDYLPFVILLFELTGLINLDSIIFNSAVAELVKS